MRRPMGLGLVLVLLALAGCTAGGGRPAPAGASGSAPPSAKARAWVPGGPYAALGDSYTAGLQLQPAGGGPKGCGRSAANYPSLVAQGLGLTGGQFTDVSCTSATTADLTGAQQVSGGPNPPQLDALNAQTRLVTVGIGGNDGGFTNVFTECAEQGLLHLVAVAKDQAPCKAHYTAADGSDQLSGVLKTVGDRVFAVLRQVAQRSPQAKVFLVGYPALLPSDPASCGGLLGDTVSKGDLAFLAEQEQRLNTVLRDQAAAAGAVYVDTYAPTQGHDMCAGQSARWVEPPLPAGGMAPLHPNLAGQQAMAAAVLGSIRAAH
ncbi:MULTISPECIES: SGNH/GDSL hydrolase family protein [Kitasatospora]|uniref:SGNH/GDSL hydrolase family protein n=1 Tax=Kitasatospora TaxID=2063 RepID=UPI000CCA26CC|nr:SGNH/GDSL hydrolase family protein [Kitasatospora sp. GP30]MDH6138841.1 lysophospholipase L1-like esterase [Kitasatospora sp. GP30]